MIKLLLFSTFLFASTLILKPTWIYDAPEGHWINWVAISQDGKRAATGTYKPNALGDYKYYYFDQDGKILYEETFSQYQNGVFAISLSDNGKLAAIGGTRSLGKTSEPDIGFIKAYNHETNEVILEATTVGRTVWIEQSSDGTWMSAISKHVQFFKLIQGQYKLIHTFEDTKSYRGLAMSSDGKYVVAGNNIGEVNVFKVEQDQVQQIYKWQMEPAINKKSSIQSLAMDASGDNFAVATNNGKLYFFSIDQKTDTVIEQGAELSPVQGNVYGVTISEDGQMIAMGTSRGHGAIEGEKQVIIFNNECIQQVCTRKPYWSFEPDRAPNPGMQFDSQNKWLVLATGYPVGTPGSFYLVDVVNKEIKMQHTVQDMNWPVAISRDGSAFFGGSDTGEMLYFKNIFN